MQKWLIGFLMAGCLLLVGLGLLNLDSVPLHAHPQAAIEAYLHYMQQPDSLSEQAVFVDQIEQQRSQLQQATAIYANHTVHFQAVAFHDTENQFYKTAVITSTLTDQFGHQHQLVDNVVVQQVRVNHQYLPSTKAEISWKIHLINGDLPQIVP
ncbi:hypothetical protein [Herpetosiphon giganteus]|uniref:hypothetical protein n=1 Tax=Herpetosiphon giganteus TaxID=2029754 RepID=UPI00195B457A|nr:hypothetical protein [Herpetosiphon giganteus]MBM7841804.1 uncharacterized protein YpiB (UPF0302 family) [Herpetosiphon giganteus]